MIVAVALPTERMEALEVELEDAPPPALSHKAERLSSPGFDSAAQWRLFPGSLQAAVPMSEAKPALNSSTPLTVNATDGRSLSFPQRN